MVELRRLAPSPRIRLFAKLEGANPTGSVKDRIARADARRGARPPGRCSPGQTILEPSSGNTGISLAMIGALLGHPVRIVMPDNTTAEREQLLRLYGAEIVYSPGRRGLERRDPPGAGAGRRRSRRSSCRTSTATRPTRAPTRRATGPEILAAVPEVDVFVAGLGTGGTLTGVGRFLKRDAARRRGSSPPSRSPGSRCRGCARWRRGSCRRCSTHRSWTTATWSATATR